MVQVLKAPRGYVGWKKRGNVVVLGGDWRAPRVKHDKREDEKGLVVHHAALPRGLLFETRSRNFE